MKFVQAYRKRIDTYNDYSYSVIEVYTDKQGRQYIKELIDFANGTGGFINGHKARYIDSESLSKLLADYEMF